MNTEAMRQHSEVFLARELVGKHVRFRHLPKDSEARPILVSGAQKNMISLVGHVGLYAPHLFVVVDPPKEAKHGRSNR